MIFVLHHGFGANVVGKPVNDKLTELVRSYHGSRDCSIRWKSLKD